MTASAKLRGLRSSPVAKWDSPTRGRITAAAARLRECEFKNHRKSRSRRGNEAEVFFALKSASYYEN